MARIVPIASLGEGVGAIGVDLDSLAGGAPAIYVKVAGSPITWERLVTVDQTVSLTNKTLTAPVVNDPTVSNGTFQTPAIGSPSISTPSISTPSITTAKGTVVGIERTFTETSGAGVWTGTVTIPAGATLVNILVSGVALWTSQTSAVLDVGDITDPDGFFTQVDLKATDLLAGESISFDNAGGKAGAYIANSQVSPRYYSGADAIKGILTKVGTSGTAGRTRMVVLYLLPVTGDVVAATKV